MKYAYIRVSSISQDFNRQLYMFEEKGIKIDNAYEEKMSGKDAKSRPQLQKLLRAVKKGDYIYVVELSRLGRSVKDLAEIAEELEKKGVYLVSLKENIDLSTATGRLMFSMLSAFAQFERECIKERQAEGIAAAMANGKSWGRQCEYEYDKEACENIFLSYQIGTIKSVEAASEAGLPYQVFLREFKKWQKAKGINPSDLRAKNGRKFKKKEEQGDGEAK